MKNIFLTPLLSLIFGFSYSQDKLDKTLNIFKKNVDPYLIQLVETEYNLKLDQKQKPENIPNANAALARIQQLRAENNIIISSEVKEQMKKEKNVTKEWLIGFISTEYKKHYTGLPKKFYDDSINEALKQ